MDLINPLIKVINTADGSNTLYHERYQEIYHSRHGAYQESMHVFIETGLKHIESRFNEVQVLEIGFGTGLNCILTYQHKTSIVHYTGIDTFPINWSTIEALRYTQLPWLEKESNIYQQIINSQWNDTHQIGPNFKLKKIKNSIFKVNLKKKFHLIYFDAFAPATQPEMWQQSLFEKLYTYMITGGCLVTYCAKGQVRRNLEQAQFSVEKMPGPVGKREMLRANFS